MPTMVVWFPPPARVTLRMPLPEIAGQKMFAPTARFRTPLSVTAPVPKELALEAISVPPLMTVPPV